MHGNSDPEGAPMEPERWQRLKAVFQAALELESRQRPAFLEESCVGDPALRNEVESLLASHKDARSFIEEPASVAMAEALVAPRSIGPYRVEEELGRGGMGVVYRGRHRETSELAAVKTVRLVRRGHLGRIRREIQALARIRHPGIVRVLEEGEQDGLPWYAMELLDGLTLREWAAREPPLRERLSLVRRLCAPLAFLHGEELVHRDLKPDNVLVRSDGQPVLVDFGLAGQFGGEVSREALELDAALAGTPKYMAPEQLRGELVDARADLYALGCVLYELVAGQPPFVGQTTAEVVSGHLQAEPPRLSSVARDVPAELEALVLRLLAKDPRQRLGYSDSVAKALAELGAEDGLAAAGPRPRAYLYRPGFAGREEVFRELALRLADLLGGAGSLVLVGGESGVGKTRLVMELAREAMRRGLRVLTGECAPVSMLDTGSATAGGTPLAALRKPLQEIADHCRERGSEETDRLLGQRGKVLALYEPALAGLPGQEAYLEPAELPPQSARLRLMIYLAETLSAFVAGKPLLLVLDDLQWADELTVEFLEFLLRGEHLQRLPLLALGTYRSEEAGEALRRLLGSGGVQPLALERLDQAALGAMVRDMLALPGVPGPLVRFLSRHSEGNPFFVAEYLRAAVGQGLLYRDHEGRWQVAEPGEEKAAEATYEALPLPRSLFGLVSQHLDRLGAETLRLVEAAAVLGREVHAPLLNAVAGLQPSQVLRATLEALHRQVMEQSGDERLRFIHDKVREVAYGAIAGERRTALHRAAAEEIEAIFGQEREQHLAELGHHWECAGEAPRARECYLAAARREAGRYSHAEADRLYSAYLRLAKSMTPQRVEARRELAVEVLKFLGRIPEAVAQLKAALGEACTLRMRAQESRVLRGLGVVSYETGQMDQARSFYEQALALERQIGDRQCEGVTLGNLGNVYREQGRVNEARALYEEAVAIAREAGDRQHGAVMLSNLALLHWEQGRMEESRVFNEQALAIARELGDLREEARILGNLANVDRQQGRMEEALRLYEQALILHRQVGHRRLEAHTLGNIAVVFHEQGRTDEGRALYVRALAVAREVGDRRFEGHTLGNLANACQDQGRLAEAAALYEQALAIAREVGNRRSEGHFLTSLGTLRAESSAEEAAALFEQSLAIAREVGNRRGEGYVLGNMAVLKRRCYGDFKEARRLVQEAESALRDAGDSLRLALCACERGHQALALGHSGSRSLDEAEQIATSMAVTPTSELGLDINRLRRAQEAFEAGRKLFRGELFEDLPEGLRRRLAESRELDQSAGEQASDSSRRREARAERKPAPQP
jgi:predicted ATPase/predicted Ser/Thr protein kinase